MGGNHKLDGSVRCYLYAFRFPVAYGFGASDFAGCGSFRFVIVGTDADWGEVGGFAQLALLVPSKVYMVVPQMSNPWKSPGVLFILTVFLTFFGRMVVPSVRS